MTTADLLDLPASAAIPETDATGLRNNVRRGLVWSLGGTLFVKFGGLVSGLVLARLLAPSDFGLYAIAIAATEFVTTIKDLGVEAATQHWRGPLKVVIPTATTISVTFCTLAYVVFFLGAPSFAALAGNADAAPVVRVLTAVMLVYGFNAVPSGVMRREFRQQQLVAANFIGVLVNAAVTISLAVAGAGAMSFAVGQVTAVVVVGGIIFALSGVSLKFGLERDIAKRLLRFGLPLTIGLAFEVVVLNTDFVVIGGKLDAQQLGFYLLAFNISSWALTSLTFAIRYVAIAGFARLSELNEETLNAGVQRSISKLYLVAAPVGALTAALARPLIMTMYGHSWEPASAVLPLLAALTVVRLMISLAHDMFIGVGATRSVMIINGIWAAALIPAMIIGVGHDGIRGAGIAHAVIGLGLAIPLTASALRRRRISLAPVLPSLIRPTIGSVVAATVAMVMCGVMRATPTLLQLVAASTCGLLTYVLIAIPQRDLRWVVTNALRRRDSERNHRRAIETNLYVN